jgi:hypothetical protein
MAKNQPKKFKTAPLRPFSNFPNPISVDPSTHSPNVFNVRFSDIKDGWEQYILLRGDAHQDNSHSRQDVEEAHLDIALAKNALIIDVGDLFCAMQGRGDPRANYNDLRVEHKRVDYLTALVETAAARYERWAKNWLLMAVGNHETAVLKNYHTHLTSNLVTMMNLMHGSNVSVGGYGGYVRFHFERYGTERSTLNLKYFHGAGGGGIVTKGMLDVVRQAAVYPDADIIVNGHVHESMVVVHQQEKLSAAGRVGTKPLYFLRTGTYKDEYRMGQGGWHVEKGRPPKPLSSILTRLWLEKGHIRQEHTQLIHEDPVTHEELEQV